MKRILKQLFKRLFCHHDYWISGIFTAGSRDHAYKEIICRCSKCGKEKSMDFKKPLDKFTEL